MSNKKPPIKMAVVEISAVEVSAVEVSVVGLVYHRCFVSLIDIGLLFHISCEHLRYV